MLTENVLESKTAQYSKLFFDFCYNNFVVDRNIPTQDPLFKQEYRLSCGCKAHIKESWFDTAVTSARINNYEPCHKHYRMFYLGWRIVLSQSHEKFPFGYHEEGLSIHRLYNEGVQFFYSTSEDVLGHTETTYFVVPNMEPELAIYFLKECSKISM